MTESDLHIDLQLFQLIAEGDEAAFRTLFDRYVPKIRPVVRAIVGSEMPVKDLIQDVFLLIWINRQKLTEVHTPESWIFRIVHYECYKWLRKQNMREKAQDRLKSIPVAFQANPTEAYSQMKETSRLLQEAVAMLPPQAGRVYRLRRESDMKIEEIAHALNLSPKTVKNTLTRALNAIRHHLAQHGIVVPFLLLACLV